MDIQTIFTLGVLPSVFIAAFVFFLSGYAAGLRIKRREREVIEASERFRKEYHSTQLRVIERELKAARQQAQAENRASFRELEHEIKSLRKQVQASTQTCELSQGSTDTGNLSDSELIEELSARYDFPSQLICRVLCIEEPKLRESLSGFLSGIETATERWGSDCDVTGLILRGTYTHTQISAMALFMEHIKTAPEFSAEEILRAMESKIRKGNPFKN